MRDSSNSLGYDVVCGHMERAAGKALSNIVLNFKTGMWHDSREKSTKEQQDEENEGKFLLFKFMTVNFIIIFTDHLTFFLAPQKKNPRLELLSAPLSFV